MFNFFNKKTQNNDIKHAESQLKTLYLQRKFLYIKEDLFRDKERLILLDFYMREIQKIECLLLKSRKGRKVLDKIFNELRK